MLLVKCHAEYSVIISEARSKNSEASKYMANAKLLPIKVKMHKALKKSFRCVSFIIKRLEAKSRNLQFLF